MDIKQALRSLDPANDEHWTTDGQPLVTVVAAFAGAEVTRQQIIRAEPMFTRASAQDFKAEAIAASEPVQSQPEVVPVVVETAPPEQVAEMEPEVIADEDSPIKGVAETATIVTDITPEQAATVVIVDQVVAMPLAEVTSSVDLLERTVAEMHRQVSQLSQRRDAINARLSETSKRAEFMAGILERSRSPEEKREKAREAIRSYQDQQQKVRTARASAADLFIRGGTTKADVVKALSGQSPLDKSMARRRGGRETQRPAPYLKSQV